MPYVRGTQGVAVDGLPVYEELRLKTVTTNHTIPGRLVVRNTDDNHVVLAGDNAINTVGYIAPVPSHDSDTDFAAEDWLRIGHGPGVVVPLTAITGQTIVKGDLLTPAANGMVKSAGATPDYAKVVAKAEESVTTGTLASAPINARMLI